MIHSANISQVVAERKSLQVSSELSRAAELLESAIAPGELVAVAQALAHIAPALWGHHKPSGPTLVWLSSERSING